jgi:hypothetical protein
LDCIRRLEDLAQLVQDNEQLYVRWSKGPEDDASETSRDDLTGVELPGLSANPLHPEDWWGDRPLQLWVARRLYDYVHLEERRGPGTRPWVLEGEEIARGPDNEPLVRCDRPVAWIADEVVRSARELVDSCSGEWGSLDREASGQ